MLRHFCNYQFIPLIETPQGLACFTITVPLFFGSDLEIVKAEKISL